MIEPDPRLAGARERVDALRAGIALQSGQPVRLIETHISWILLTPTLAYKLKKPVRLPFLDFSTLAARRSGPCGPCGPVRGPGVWRRLGPRVANNTTGCSLGGGPQGRQQSRQPTASRPLWRDRFQHNEACGLGCAAVRCTEPMASRARRASAMTGASCERLTRSKGFFCCTPWACAIGPTAPRGIDRAARTRSPAILAPASVFRCAGRRAGP